MLRNHLDVVVSVNSYNPTAAGVAADLRGPIGPMAPVLERLDPLLTNPIYLTDEEFRSVGGFCEKRSARSARQAGESPEAGAEERPQRGSYLRIPTLGFLLFSPLVVHQITNS